MGLHCRAVVRLLRRGIIVPIAVVIVLAINSDAYSQSVRIVALGASNTAGKGVGASAAWPARLGAMLRGRNINAEVINAGINGDDTGRMRARMDSAVPPGTRVVILDKAASNDRKRSVDTSSNIAAMSRSLQARGIKVIVIEGMHGWANRQLQPDGIHITAAGHQAVAKRLLPLVVSAVGNRK